MTTALFWHSRFLWHDPGPAAGVFPADRVIQPGIHVDNADRVHRVQALLDATALTDRLRVVRPRPATDEELLRFHTKDYLERIRELSALGAGDAGDGTAPVTAGTDEAARLAAGACLQAVELVVDGEVDNAYALVRPAGHHAGPETGCGGCIFAYETLSVLHARAARGLRRVAVVDWDVHHGNGAQGAFYDDPDALTISLHQDGWFPPDSGPVEETGGPGAEGMNINLPLPPGSGEGAYFDAFERVVIPALHDFEPELIVVGAGYDAGLMDPNARMLLHGGSYRRLARYVMDAADALCGGRLVVIHEGGYNVAAVPFSAVAVIETLSGSPPSDDPFSTIGAANSWQALQPHQKAVVDRALELRAEARSAADRAS